MIDTHGKPSGHGNEKEAKHRGSMAALGIDPTVPMEDASPLKSKVRSRWGTVKMATKVAVKIDQ